MFSANFCPQSKTRSSFFSFLLFSTGACFDTEENLSKKKRTRQKQQSFQLIQKNGVPPRSMLEETTLKFRMEIFVGTYMRRWFSPYVVP
jgi:hypothetical protein